MQIPSELKEQKNTTYLDPIMKFNVGTLSYIPTMPKKLQDDKLPKRDKIKIWILGIILVLMMIAMLALVFNI